MKADTIMGIFLVGVALVIIALLVLLANCGRKRYPAFNLNGNIYPRYWKDQRTDICFAYINDSRYGISFTTVDCGKVESYLEDDKKDG